MEGGIRIMKRRGKRLLAVVILTSMTLLGGMTALAASGGGTAAKTQTKEAQTKDTQTKDEKTKKFGFTYKEVRYELGADAEAAKKTLGESNGSREVNTCANGYINRAYTYGEGDSQDFEVYVEQDKKTSKDIIASITLLTANVATEEGLKVGDSAETVTKIYPTAVKGLGTYKVTEDKELLYIKMTGGKVAYISYTVTE